MPTYWDAFLESHRDNVLYEWSVRKLLEEYTKWLAVQPSCVELINTLWNEAHKES